jgi:hypothetical protein
MTTNALLALIAARKAASNRGDTEKPPMGRSRWRILPGWRNPAKAPANLDDAGKAEWAAQFFHDFGQHFVKDASNQVKAVYPCVDKIFGRPCQICDEISRGIVASQDDVTKKRLEDAKAAGRVLVNAVRLDGPGGHKVVVLELAPSAFNGKKGVGGVLSLFQDWPNLLDWDLGNDIIIERAGQGKDTTYGISAVPPSVKLDKASLIGQLTDLDAYVQREENAGAQRALAAVGAISGLLPAPTRPALTQAAAAAFAPAPQTAQVLNDIPDFPSNAAPNPFEPAPAVAPAPVAPVAMPTVTQVAPAPVAPQPVAAPAANPLAGISPEQLAAMMALLQQQQGAAPTATVAAPVAPAPVAAPVQAPAPASSGMSLEDMLKDLP